MRKQNRKQGQEGFTLIEVVASAALLTIAATGFLMMEGANSGLLVKEQRLDQSNYRIGAMAEEGVGERPGEILSVSFTPEEGFNFPSGEVREVFDQYIVRDRGDKGKSQDGDTDMQEENGETAGNFITVYRHR